MTENKINTPSFLWELLSATSIEDLNYLYKGEFSEDIAHYLLLLAEKNIERDQLKGRVKKRVFHILVESVQNITRHQDVIEEKNIQKALFSIQKFKNIYLVTTANLVKKTKIPYLQQKLETINSMSEEELTQFYKDVLIEDSFTAKGGAGLGLIEIARKSGNKLLYDFKDYDSNHSFFYMHTFIKLDQGQSGSGKIFLPRTYSFDYIKSIHDSLERENILLVYCSVFDQPSLITLISILNSQIKGDLPFRKKIISTLVEMLQNIIHHGYVRKDQKGRGALGMFYISYKDQIFSLNTINYVSNKDARELRSYLDYINGMDKNELEQAYNKQLLNFSDEETNLGGLGFLEMRLKSENPLLYEIKQINEFISYFALKVNFSLKKSDDGKTHNKED